MTRAEVIILKKRKNIKALSEDPDLNQDNKLDVILTQVRIFTRLLSISINPIISKST